jgi:hypothetical protein
MLIWKTVTGRFTIESSEKVQPDKISAALVFHTQAATGAAHHPLDAHDDFKRYDSSFQVMQYRPAHYPLDAHYDSVVHERQHELISGFIV